MKKELCVKLVIYKDYGMLRVMYGAISREKMKKLRE